MEFRAKVLEDNSNVFFHRVSCVTGPVLELFTQVTSSLKLYVIAAYVFVWVILFWRGDYVFDSESVSEVIAGVSQWYQVQSQASVGEL